MEQASDRCWTWFVGLPSLDRRCVASSLVRDRVPLNARADSLWRFLFVYEILGLR